MTVLDLDIARETAFDQAESRAEYAARRSRGRSSGYLARVRRSALRLMTEDLPADVRDEEVSVILCFQASVLLNVTLGGVDDMTFSARCHIAKRRAGRRDGGYGRALRWAFWAVMAAVIDLLCAMLRGEREHCATAWDNHLARFR